MLDSIVRLRALRMFVLLVALAAACEGGGGGVDDGGGGEDEDGEENGRASLPLVEDRKVTVIPWAHMTVRSR